MDKENLKRLQKDFLLDLISVYLDYTYFYIRDYKKIDPKDLTLDNFKDKEFQFIMSFGSCIFVLYTLKEHINLLNTIFPNEKYSYSSIVMDYLLSRSDL